MMSVPLASQRFTDPTENLFPESALGNRGGAQQSNDKPPKGDDLKRAFQLFNEMSEQLSESYTLLEDRVTELTQELNTVSAKRLEELAEKERLANRLENLLTVLPGGVVVLDARGRVSECNPAAMDMLGEPLEGMLWRDVILRSFAPRSDDGHEVSTKDGRRISIATRSLEVEGHQDGQIILLTDQTETRRLQSELSRHERLSALGKMVSALAHQIRTPLSAAMLYAGHLRGGQLKPQQQQKFSDKLLKRLNHMERQVQDMLMFVKGDIPLPDMICIEELQESLSEEMEVLMETSQSHCEWRNQCPTHMLRCNQDVLVGALLNLVNNAVQAVETGARLTISFDLQMFDQQNQQPQLVISVVDSGPGIKQEMLESVVDVFMTTKPQGTGLGLSVVQTVARAHGGRLQLQSQEGQGTCARIVLPLASLSKDVFSGADESRGENRIELQKVAGQSFSPEPLVAQ
jgi:two-component system, sensor histidine kinase FlrB